MSTSERIDELENQFRSAKRDYLKRFGWTETCKSDLPTHWRELPVDPSPTEGEAR